ncbi:biopolymer transporter ExbD [Mucilaginibacter sp. BJC16-A38]|uniref:ExbD/TolR family protein n=1 Tax=Mucilaginibacter phenanthrenivorans TaxID=1234842 RepID=UPI002156F8E2|nr:biopolymer transporter ExbD [Mucilaginibacter phenanthrenivorans]MCR8558521.1 biopolymer transporter ExbD [Mucilaginibacter phenanthrenivorans]
MPRVKVARKSTAIDMTAMCDVAFLLLTFFILTAKPKVEDPSKAEVPASIKEVTIPDDNVLTISVGKQNKMFLSFSGTDVRAETLKSMGEKYKVDFTPAEINRFSNTEVFGVPMSQLKQFLGTPTSDLKSFEQRGIPADTTVSNELSDWILTARKADKGLHNQDYHIAIKGDRQEQYPAINTVIAILGHQKQFKFDLITSLKAAPKK